MKPDGFVGLDAIEAARERVSKVAIRTPVIGVPPLSRIAGSEVRLKLENLQPTGSFKVRGAASAILALGDGSTGVVTASTGNHGRAVAHVGAELGVPVTVCVSRHVPTGKVKALESSGCRVIVGGDSQDDAMETARALVESEGLSLVHPFDDPGVVAGQGTIGLELSEQYPELTHVVVPLSGGGLISGIAAAIKAIAPEVNVIGVSMVDGAAMVASLQAGRPVELEEHPTLADSLQGGIGVNNSLTFPMVRDLVDEALIVSEDLIWDAMSWSFHNAGLVLEGGGAVGIAAVLSGLIDPGARIAVVCSGGNIETEHLRLISRGRTRPETSNPKTQSQDGPT